MKNLEIKTTHGEDINKYMGTIKKAVMKLKPSEEHFEDMVQEGVLIFFEALNCYDSTKGAKFITHLVIHLKKLNYRYWYKQQDKAFLFKYNKQHAMQSDYNAIFNTAANGDSELVEFEPFDEACTLDMNMLYTELTVDAKKLHGELVSGQLLSNLGKQLRLTYNNLLELVSKWGWDSSRLKKALADLRDFIYEIFDNTVDPGGICYKHNQLN